MKWECLRVKNHGVRGVFPGVYRKKRERMLVLGGVKFSSSRKGGTLRGEGGGNQTPSHVQLRED